MLFEQYAYPDYLPPSIEDGGISKFNSSFTSLDFYLLDDIDTYLPPIHSEKTKNDLINDSTNDNSAYQLPDDFFSDIDLSELSHFDEKSEHLPIDELDIEKWISEVSFPSPPMDTISSSISNIEDTSSLFSEQYPINTEMTAPSPPSSTSSSPSPSSTSSSSPEPSFKRTKLSTVERKLRKKGQNKTAAEKYRVKKKSERHQLLDRHAKLQARNKGLKLELEDLTYRVQQFKQLFANLVQTN